MLGNQQTLIENFRRGKESAMKQLYDCFYLSLCAYSSRYVRDDDVAFDIVQEVFVKLWDKRQDFYTLHSLRSFLYVSVRNASLNELRKQNRYPKESLPETLSDSEESFVIEEEVHRMIHEEITRLPNAMRTVFEMTIKGMSISEIAKTLSLSENTVRNQRAVARKKLQEKLRRWIFSLIF